MTAVELLTELRQMGVEVTVIEGPKVRWRAPKGVMTPDLKEAVRRFKPDLLALLTWERMPCLAPTESLPALKDEEPLYRLWWKTLPDKKLARRLDGHLPYWQRERRLSDEATAWLRGRVQDLLSPKREQGETLE